MRDLILSKVVVCNAVSWSFSESSLESHFVVVCVNCEIACARI